jgi:hypothetical protein
MSLLVNYSPSSQSKEGQAPPPPTQQKPAEHKVVPSQSSGKEKRRSALEDEEDPFLEDGPRKNPRDNFTSEQAKQAFIFSTENINKAAAKPKKTVRLSTSQFLTLLFRDPPFLEYKAYKTCCTPTPK